MKFRDYDTKEVINPNARPPKHRVEQGDTVLINDRLYVVEHNHWGMGDNPMAPSASYEQVAYVRRVQSSLNDYIDGVI